MSDIPAYLIVGDDPYLISTEIEQIVGDADPLSVDDRESVEDVASVLQTLETPPLFGDKRTVIIRGVAELPQDQLRRLIDYLEQPSDSGTLVLVAPRVPAKLQEAVRKTGRIVEAGRGKKTDVLDWLRKEARSKGVKLAGDGAAALLETIGEERVALATALDELALAFPGASVGGEQIRAQFHMRADMKLYTFVDAVASRNLGLSLELLRRLLRQGETPSSLFWALAKQVRMMLVAAGSPARQVAEALRLPEWRAEKIVRQARSFTIDELVDSYRLMAEADHRMKLSEEPDALTLERVVLKIASRG